MSRREVYHSPFHVTDAVPKLLSSDLKRPRSTSYTCGSGGSCFGSSKKEGTPLRHSYESGRSIMAFPFCYFAGSRSDGSTTTASTGTSQWNPINGINIYPCPIGPGAGGPFEQQR